MRDAMGYRHIPRLRVGSAMRRTRDRQMQRLAMGLDFQCGFVGAPSQVGLIEAIQTTADKIREDYRLSVQRPLGEWHL